MQRCGGIVGSWEGSCYWSVGGSSVWSLSYNWPLWIYTVCCIDIFFVLLS